MATQKKQRLEDVERVRQIQRTSLEMMTVMHRGLSAIAKGELSETGARAMKRLAGQTLDEVQNIALELEPQERAKSEVVGAGLVPAQSDECR
jgi:hypothetical protein